MRRLTAVIGLLALACATTASAGKVYRWVDKDGRVHFSDSPASASAQEIDPRTTSPGPQVAAATAVADASAQCTEKRQKLAEYQAAPAIIERDALGNEVRFSEEQRSAFLARQQQEADAACTGAPPPPQ